MRKNMKYTDYCRETIIMCKQFNFPYVFIIIDTELEMAVDVKATVDLAEQTVTELCIRYKKDKFIYDKIDLR